jgi:osmotically-inducible protein OsmY
VKKVVLLGLAALLLEGCVPLVVGGAAAGAGYAAGQERSPVQQANDVGIRAQVVDKWDRFNPELASNLSCTVYDGKVLVTGTVKNPEWRVDAVRLAWQVEGVKEVHSEAQVSDKTSLSDDARDTWITTRLRSALTFDPNVRSLNYTIETVNGTIYLIGSARTQNELTRVTNHARNIPNVRKVVTYVDIRPGEPTTATAGTPPASAPPPAGGAPVDIGTSAPAAEPQGGAPTTLPSGPPAPVEVRPLS